MQHKGFLLGFIFGSIFSKGFGQKKQIIYTKLKCDLKSNKLESVQCLQVGNSALTVQLRTNDNQIDNLVGISDVNLYIFSANNVMRLKKLRTELCKTSTPSNRPNFQSFLYQGLQQADNNLIEKCPLKKNTTYTLRNIRFNANYFPSYLPEYNFTYTGKFYANNVITLELRTEGSFCNMDTCTV